MPIEEIQNTFFIHYIKFRAETYVVGQKSHDVFAIN